MSSPLNPPRVTRTSPSGQEDEVRRSCHSDGSLLEPDAALLLIEGRAFRVVCVDGVEPMLVSRPGSPRQQYAYHRHEVAHFGVGQSRFALVPVQTSELPTDESAAATRDPRGLLTSREMQIVQLICMGMLTKQVADRLHLSEFTVRSYLKTIYCKLGVRSRGGMVYAFAKAFGLSADKQASATKI